MKTRANCVSCDKDFTIRNESIDVAICPHCSAEYDVVKSSTHDEDLWTLTLIQAEPDAHEDASDLHVKCGEVLDEIERVFGVPICPEKCPYMSLWEENQTDTKIPHVCRRYNTTLNHGTVHPRIVRVPDCDYAEGSRWSNG